MPRPCLTGNRIGLGVEGAGLVCYHHRGLEGLYDLWGNKSEIIITRGRRERQEGGEERGGRERGGGTKGERLLNPSRSKYESEIG